MNDSSFSLLFSLEFRKPIVDLAEVWPFPRATPMRKSDIDELGFKQRTYASLRKSYNREQLSDTKEYPSQLTRIFLKKFKNR